MVIRSDHSSPNFFKRRLPIDTIVIHHTGGRFPGCAEWLCNPESKASAHYLITQGGAIYRLVPDGYAAMHAGLSGNDYDRDGTIAKQERTINSRSIGIELESVDGKYSEIQLAVLKILVESLSGKYRVKREHILGHKEIAPGRKIDPSFDMNEFRGALTL
jgi:N-acetylmuramoyl-L-alanine amidase